VSLGPQVASWALFLVYCLWGVALQGILSSPRALGEFVPDIGLLLLFAWVVRLHGARGVAAAACVGLARAAVGADPAAAVLAATLGVLGLFAGLRTFLMVDRPLPRAVLCGLAVWLSGWFLIETRSYALASETPAVHIEGVRLWPSALVTGLACLALTAPLLRLPGLSPLARKRP
jgi:hypothetical protein